jgi:hypothetical protein
MAGELFKRAAAYRKKHAGMTMPEAVKALSKKGPAKKKAPARKKAAPKKRAAVGKAKRKKASPKAAAPKKVKIKLKRTKGGISLGISGISIDKIQNELKHIHQLEAMMQQNRVVIKQSGVSPAEKNKLRRENVKYRNNISASKKHISALKRSI